ncbi:hypothetical protein RF11_02729 [Thelohanellus kitauei]|uniref:Uncharacterized protein n=1 Tax=Thelohanellus kitauei TaxID=669202 RepID=A0A0C2IIY8_THEKT|nr:hypothetical protein RF11_02729 [Thelohanellus kitauei]
MAIIVISLSCLWASSTTLNSKTITEFTDLESESAKMFLFPGICYMIQLYSDKKLSLLACRPCASLKVDNINLSIDCSVVLFCAIKFTACESNYFLSSAFPFNERCAQSLGRRISS